MKVERLPARLNHPIQRRERPLLYRLTNPSHQREIVSEVVDTRQLGPQHLSDLEQVMDIGPGVSPTSKTGAGRVNRAGILGVS